MRVRPQPTAVLEAIAALRRAFERAVYKLRVDAGMCAKITCPRLAEAPSRYCHRHRDARNRVSKALSAQQIKDGLCDIPGCPSPPVRDRKRCAIHLKKRAIHNQKRRKKRRSERKVSP